MLRLTKKRREKELSQSQLSHKSGVHVSSISAIESGRLKAWPGQQTKLAKALGWPEDRAAELFEEVEA